MEKSWSPEDEAALEADLERGPELLRERLLLRYAEARRRQEARELRRARLRRLSFGLLGR